jgi:hypothetical protein
MDFSTSRNALKQCNKTAQAYPNAVLLKIYWANLAASASLSERLALAQITLLMLIFQN